MSTTLYILGVALVVFVFLGSVRRVRRPELLRAPPGTCPGAPCTRRLSESPSHPRPARESKRGQRGQEDRDDEGSVSNPEKTITSHLAGSTRNVSFENPRRPRIRVPGDRDRPDVRDVPDHDGHGGAEGQAWGTRHEDRHRRLVKAATAISGTR